MPGPTVSEAITANTVHALRKKAQSCHWQLAGYFNKPRLTRYQMNSPFTHTDLFNLEFFLGKDKTQSQEYLHERDRKIFLSLEKKNRDDRLLLHYWLKKRTSTDDNGNLPGPGEIITDSFKLVTLFLSLLGFIGGLSAGLGFFTYTGEAPVNVFHFLILFVFSQFLLLFFIIAAAVASKISSQSHTLAGASALYSYLAAGLAGRIRKGIAGTVSTESRDRYQQTTGLIKKVRLRYGKVMIWPFFLLSQKIIIALNIGVFTATLFKIATSDLAFGWQSTLDISSRTLFLMVKALAAPWSWIIPETLAFPSKQAIEGSRIFLKDGIYHLASSDLTAWWPFLVLCLFCYGLLPRLLLFFVGVVLQKRSLDRFQPGTPEAHMVLHRMKTPRVSTNAEKSNHGETAASRTDDSDDGIPQNRGTNTSVLLLIPEDIGKAHGRREIAFMVEELGYAIAKIESVMENFDVDRKLFKELKENRNNITDAVILIMESWMPPIGDTFSFLKELTASLDNTLPCYLGLLTKPEHEQVKERQKQAVKVWQTRIDKLGSPCLSVIPLGSPRKITEYDSRNRHNRSSQ